MKAVRLVEVHRPLQMQELDVPTIGQNDVLVRVKAAGICHTDVHYQAGKSPIQPLPRTLGHEIAGVVEQVGNQATAVKVGDRVCVHYVLSCGNCYFGSSLTHCAIAGRCHQPGAGQSRTFSQRCSHRNCTMSRKTNLINKIPIKMSAI